jgi:hypothetical protein
MSLLTTPVSTTDVLNLQAGIEGFTNAAEATAEVALINAGTDTVAAYAHRLEVANTATSEAVVATVSLMEGGTPTAGKLLSPTSPANEFQHLIVDYLPAQQVFAVANKLNSTIYDAEVIGLGIGADGDGTQNNFLKNSSKLTLSQFESTLSGFTNVSEAAIDAQYQFFVKLYGAPGNLPAGYPSADAAARAVTFGFAVGTDLADPTLNPTLFSQIENAKELNAETINGDVSGTAGYQNNVALALQPTALPLQGVFTLTPGIDTITTSLKGAIFNALPALSAFGTVSNTLNTGDTLTDNAGDGTINFTALPVNALGTHPPLAGGVTMKGIASANITTAADGDVVGFTGNITGLTTVSLSGIPDNTIRLGGPPGLPAGGGLNTALSTVNFNANLNFSAVIAAAALASSPAVTINANTALGTSEDPAVISFQDDSGVRGTAGSPMQIYGTETINTKATSFLQLQNDKTGNVSTTKLVMNAAGNTEFESAETAGKSDFTKVTSIDASGSSATVGISGNLNVQSNGDDLSGGGVTDVVGLLNGNAMLSSFNGGTGKNYLDVSSLNATQVAALTADATASKAGTNEIDFNNGVFNAATGTTIANIKGFQIAGVDFTGGTTTVSAAQLDNQFNDVLYKNGATGAVTVTNAPTVFTVDTESFGGGNTLSVTGPAGLADTLNVIIGKNAVGDEPAAAGTLGAVTIVADEIVHILSQGVDGNTIASTAGSPAVALTPSFPGGNEQVFIDGSKAIAFGSTNTGVNVTGAIADVVAGALNVNNMTITITDMGVVMFNGAFETATPLHFTPAGDSTDLVFSTNAAVINASASGGLIMTAGDANYTAATSAGDVITGSATAGNVLGGSIGNDVITANNNAANTIYTNGGADIVSLGASHPSNHVEIYGGFTTPGITPGGVEVVRLENLTERNDFAQLGWWGLGTAATEAGYTAGGNVYAGLAAETGTSADAVTINNFLTTDVIDLSSSNSFAWGFGDLNGVGAGDALGLVQGNFANNWGANNGSVQNIIGTTLGLPNANNTVLAGTNIIELTGQQFGGPSDVANYLHNIATNVFFGSGVLPTNDSAHMIVVYSDVADGKTHVADLALIANTGASNNTSLMIEHVSDLAIVGTPLAATAAAIHFV